MQPKFFSHLGATCVFSLSLFYCTLWSAVSLFPPSLSLSVSCMTLQTELAINAPLLAATPQSLTRTWPGTKSVGPNGRWCGKCNNGGGTCNITRHVLPRVDTCVSMWSPLGNESVAPTQLPYCLTLCLLPRCGMTLPNASLMCHHPWRPVEWKFVEINVFILRAIVIKWNCRKINKR